MKWRPGTMHSAPALLSTLPFTGWSAAASTQVRGETFSEFLDRWSGLRDLHPETATFVPLRMATATSSKQDGGLVAARISANEPIRQGSPNISGREAVKAEGGARFAMRVDATSAGAKLSGLSVLPFELPRQATESPTMQLAQRVIRDRQMWSQVAVSFLRESSGEATLVVRADTETSRILTVNLDRLRNLARELGIEIGGLLLNGKHQVVSPLKGESNGY